MSKTPRNCLQHAPCKFRLITSLQQGVKPTGRSHKEYPCTIKNYALTNIKLFLLQIDQRNLQAFIYLALYSIFLNNILCLLIHDLLHDICHTVSFWLLLLIGTPWLWPMSGRNMQQEHCRQSDVILQLKCICWFNYLRFYNTTHCDMQCCNTEKLLS